MSLLLDALKKAERAKEEAQRRSGESSNAAPLQLAKEDAPAEQGKHVTMRSELPDISQPLEILSDDITPKRPAGGAAEAARPSGGSSIPPRPQGAAGNSAEASLQRAAARKVFEAKFKETNPRLPFFITLGVLGLFALGTVGYFWYQMRPPAPLVAANPAPPTGERAVAAVVPQAAPGQAGSSASGPVAGLPGSATAIPGLPGATPASQAGALAAPSPAPEASAAVKPPSRAPAVPRAAQRSAPERAPLAASSPSASRGAAQVHPKVDSAYVAYRAGNLAVAREDYQQALRDDPGNRDALLGLAAIDARGGRLGPAEAAYVRLLQIDPRDPHAQAGLIALRAGRVDPVAAESRVKTLLASDPGAHVLYFTLGNQLAQQDRWAEAQQQYFKAFTAEPDNPDFAYNLAVSLDHMRQPRLALEYYQRALALASQRGASFDAAAARERVAQLGK